LRADYNKLWQKFASNETKPTFLSYV
jgi:hypothetical protein